MNIYQLKGNELKEQSKKFHQTSYGKRIFYFSYAPTIIGLLASIVVCIPSMISWIVKWLSNPITLILVLISVFAFFLGNIYYYHKLETFIEKTNEK